MEDREGHRAPVCQVVQGCRTEHWGGRSSAGAQADTPVTLHHGPLASPGHEVRWKLWALSVQKTTKPRVAAQAGADPGASEQQEGL